MEEAVSVFFYVDFMEQFFFCSVVVVVKFVRVGVVWLFVVFFQVHGFVGMIFVGML